MLLQISQIISVNAIISCKSSIFIPFTIAPLNNIGLLSELLFDFFLISMQPFVYLFGAMKDIFWGYFHQISVIILSHCASAVFKSLADVLD